MSLIRFLGGRVRGVRVLDLIAIGILAVLAPSVYLAKAGAGGTRADIDKVQQQIVDEQAQIRLLTATVATEEQPAHLAALSAQVLHWQPISANHEVPIEALADVAHMPAPKAAATTPAASDPTQAPTTPATAPAPQAPH